jgi:hypothetical protein
MSVLYKKLVSPLVEVCRSREMDFETVKETDFGEKRRD